MAYSATIPKPLQRPRIYWALADMWTLFTRSVIQIFNDPGQLVFGVLLQPIMLIVLFSVMFGGAINTGPINYVSFILPGILITTALSIATITMVSITSDMTKGMIDRFRSLPMVKPAIFGGTVLSSAIRCLLAAITMILVGLLMGFHMQASVGALLAALGLVLLVAYAFSWLFAVLGLTAKTVESAQQMTGLVWPLFFVSGAFVPVQSMPGWLQVFAANQPITHAIDAVRALLLGRPVGNHAWITIAWCAAIIAVSIPLATLLFKRKFK